MNRPADSLFRHLDRTHKPTGWMAYGNCAGMDPEVFFIERGGNPEPAKTVCRSCTVQTECRTYADTKPYEDDGIWGGLSAQERQRARRARQRAALKQRSVA